MIQKNTATSLLEEVCTNKTRAQAQGQWKQHARDDRGQHSRTKRGGIYLLSGADVLIESGAALVIQKNTATSLYGGGLYQQDEGSSFRASGNSTRVTIEGNTAGQRGGGIFLWDGADVLIESGAELHITNNMCAVRGAGLSLSGVGTSLTITGFTTRFHVLNNIVICKDLISTSDCGGGGLSLDSGASALITSPSLFRGNRANTGAGGAVEFHGKDDGGASACVSVRLEMKGNRSAASGLDKRARVQVHFTDVES